MVLPVKPDFLLPYYMILHYTANFPVVLLMICLKIYACYMWLNQVCVLWRQGRQLELHDQASLFFHSHFRFSPLSMFSKTGTQDWLLGISLQAHSENLPTLSPVSLCIIYMNIYIYSHCWHFNHLPVLNDYHLAAFIPRLSLQLGRFLLDFNHVLIM